MNNITPHRHKQAKLFSTLLAICISSLLFASDINKLPTNAQYGFIENKGQIIDQFKHQINDVLFLFKTGNLQVQLKQTGFSYEVHKLITKSLTTGQEITPSVLSNDSFQSDLFVHRIDISFLNANKEVNISAFEPYTDYINYYTTSTPEEGVVNVKHYKKVLYKNIYPNIDVEFMVSLKDKSNAGIKYNIIVHPGGNLQDVQLKIDGANHTSLTPTGNILIETEYGNIEETIPYTYQFSQPNNNETRTASFKQISSNLFGIDVKQYNPKQTLVIDPAPWSSYYGGSLDEISYGITLSDSSSITIVGATLSSNNIATAGAYKTTFVSVGTLFDAFIVKFNLTGTRLWGTYYGQANDDKGSSIAADSDGNIFITGITDSPTGLATTGAQQTINSGNYDAFLAKLNSFGHLIWATYFGGNGVENYAQAGIFGKVGGKIAIDRQNNVIISGATNSTSGIATLGSHQTINAGNYDAYIAKFDSSGVLIWSTFYGGNNDENFHLFRINSNDLTIDNDNNILVTGSTTSTNGISTIGAFQVSKTTSLDTYIAKFNPNGQRIWGTYFGGNFADYSFGIAVDNNNSIYITGATLSSNLHTSNAFQTIYVGAQNGTGFGDAFIAKFDSSGYRLWCTYYGNMGVDAGISIKSYDTTIIIVGFTQSTINIATSGTYQTNNNGGILDGFITKFGSSGNRIWGTYFGGTCEDAIYGLTVNNNGNIYISGLTCSNINIATFGSHQTLRNGNYDAFIAAFSSDGVLPVTWLDFTAKLTENNSVKLHWQTASEINNKGFYVERSFNATDFEQIGFVKGNGNTSTISNYNFTDQLQTKNFEHRTSNFEPNIVYYRLKQIDFDGVYDYSKTISVNTQQANDAITWLSVFPNPASNEITIESNNDAIENIIFYNTQGIICKQIHADNKLVTIQIEDLKTGLYQVWVQTKMANKCIKVVVK